MSRRVIAYGFGFMWLSLFTLLNGCGSVCQRCAPDRPVERAATTTPSRAVQELLAQRTWAAFVGQRAAHEQNAMQVAAIDADHDRVVHLPRVSLQVGTPIPLATAMQMLLAETGYSVVYGVGVDAQRLAKGIGRENDLRDHRLFEPGKESVDQGFAVRATMGELGDAL